MVKLFDEIWMNLDIDDPVSLLSKIPIDILENQQDWDLLSNPEEVLLGVPQGTIKILLKMINDKNMWPSLYEVAINHSDQWMLDLSDFFLMKKCLLSHAFHFLRLPKMSMLKFA